MLFLLAVPVATALVPSVSAKDINVVVGGSGQLAFIPNNVAASPGDSIVFQFQSNTNHSVTQSTFANPCQIQTNPAQGVDSGFQPVAASETQLPQWSITINDVAPLWFFCAQTNPVSHCQQSGMVFAVNANEEGSETFAVFQARARAGTSTSSSASTSATSSPPSKSSSPTSSDPRTSSASSVPSTTHSNSATPSSVATSRKSLAGPIAGGVVGGLLLLAMLGFLLCWARRRRSTVATSPSDIPDAEKPAPVHRPLDAGVRMQDEPTPAQLFSTLPTGETQLSLTPGPLPRGILVEEEKGRFAAAQRMTDIQQEIRELPERAEARGPAEFPPESSKGQTSSTTAELLDVIRILGGQVHALEQQIQAIGQAPAEGPPQYTVSS